MIQQMIKHRYNDMSVLISHQRSLIHDTLAIEGGVVSLLVHRELEVDYLQKIFGDID